MTVSNQVPPAKRLSSGIPGLDTILQGGFFYENLYLVLGPPGAGKTILANQICFYHAARGNKAIYLTLLAESHGAMLQHIRELEFFDFELVSKSVQYYSGYKPLEEAGLDGLLEFLHDIMTQESPSIIVVDGMATVEAAVQHEIDFKRFVHQLQLLSSTYGCTTFLLTHAYMENAIQPEHTMVDGILELNDRTLGVQSVRELRIRKLRGSAYLRGQHCFDITDKGIFVYPRIESLRPCHHVPTFDVDSRAPFHIEVLDGMLNGGLPAGSTAIIMGPVGSGKTLLGLQFLAAGAADDEPGLHVSFFEAPTEIIMKAEGAGLDFSALYESNKLNILWQSALETSVDRIAEQILDQVNRLGIRRLFIDGLQGWQQAAVAMERLPRFLAALAHELSIRKVTTVLSAETGETATKGRTSLPRELTSVAGTIIGLGRIYVGPNRYRMMEVIRMRHGRHDAGIHEFSISDRGIEVAQMNETADDFFSTRFPQKQARGAPVASDRDE